ncbi:hypothetical protein M2480_001788 [Parabacteroides sp. PFB2-12]|uniref:hypothetical protein n=1 Tax=unclassified Parabacteroides TaxID=2649774 RepID=UPI002473966B|nr:MULTISPECIES: hypothetical protein [unclassified Parabacteroides]MDH6343162.1 hypothetical protein [Parabacteroides sp. PM6-13]MDH6390806.1 hypothetical protein [Parabacteroides sp. PFB2-12]
MIYYDSLEVERLKSLIDNKRTYLSKIQNKTSYQHTEKEILFLTNDILPIVAGNTMISHNDFAKYAIRSYNAAIDYKCNGLLMYVPISDQYEERPVVGIVNSRELVRFEYGAIEVCIDNMDGFGYPVTPINLPLNCVL